MKLNVIEILQDCSLFSEVDEHGFQRLVTIAEMVRFPKGRLIFREGQPCPGAYIVGRGMVRVYKTGPSGKEHVLHIAVPGQSFAEVAAMADIENPASAEAITDSECAFLDGARFRALLDEDHPFCRQMLTSMAVWVRRLVRQLEDVVLHDALGRLARYLLEVYQENRLRAGLSAEVPPGGHLHTEGTATTVELPALKRHVASYLNLTSETFSRTLRRLEELNVIAQEENNTVRLLDLTQLRQLAKGSD